MKDSPIKSSFSSTWGTMNPLKQLVWTAKDTYAECVGCGEYFEQYSLKKICQLCWKMYCSTCGTSPIRFSSQLFPGINQKAGVYELKACQLCKKSIGFVSRKHCFSSKKEIQRSELIQSRHKELQEIRTTIDRLLDEFFSISQPTAPAAEVFFSSNFNFFYKIF